MNYVKAGDVFSDEQLKQIMRCRTTKERLALAEKLLPVIDKNTGQENDAGHWAYVFEYLQIQAGIKPEIH